MRTFLLNSNKTPIIKWSNLEEGQQFLGTVPENYFLAVCPDWGTIILDVDKKGIKNGYDFIPKHILKELEESFWYYTKSGGAHFFIKYTGHRILLNKSTSQGLDLRIGKNPITKNNGGYVRYQGNQPIQNCIHLIKESSQELNQWLEKLFSNEQ
jgi:hypothetical protein